MAALPYFMVAPYVVNDFWDVLRGAANCHGACSHSPRVSERLI